MAAARILAEHPYHPAGMALDQPADKRSGPRVPWSSAWRAEVRDQAQRLDDDLVAVPAAASSPTYQETRKSIDRARVFADTAPTPAAWWSGSSVEGAWSNLGAAREALVGIQADAIVCAQLPYLRSLATSDTTKGLIPAEDAPAIADRAALAQVMRVHNVQVAIEHGNVRKLRNGVLGLTALLAVIMSVAAIVTDQEHRIVIGVGAIAGALTTVMAVTSTQGAPGPYSVLGPQVLLKVFAGSATALLAVLLLYNGVGTLGPARGDAAYFVAAVFGFSQQLFTQLVDSKAKTVVGQATPRSATVAATGVKPPGHP
jgi:hypothetical protein